MKKLILAAMLALMITASATDYQCLSDCLNRGYMYSYCQKFCSY